MAWVKEYFGNVSMSTYALVLICFFLFSNTASAQPPKSDGAVYSIASDSINVGQLMFSQCDMQSSYKRRDAECATLEVPENWQDPNSTKIELFIVRIPAQRKAYTLPDPMVFLAGGPGQAASEAFLFADRLYPELAEERDFYFIDQRGTGKSSPLSCEQLEEIYRLSNSDDVKELQSLIAECLRTINANVQHYTTASSIEDLEAVREQLDIQQWNILGVSYGTRLAQRYAQRYPNSIRSMILDSVVPVGHVLGSEVGVHSQAALDVLLQECHAQKQCDHTFSGLLARLENISQHPFGYYDDIRVENLLTGSLEKAVLSEIEVLSYIRFGLYASETRAVLLSVLNEAIVHGNAAPLIRAVRMQQQSLQKSISALLHYSVACAEDYPALKKLVETGAIDSSGYLGQSVEAAMMAVCDVWPSPLEAPANSTLQKEMLLPTLLFAGELDPITPPQYAYDAGESFSLAKVLVVPHRGHFVSHYGCGPKLLKQFVSAKSAEALDASCLKRLNQTPIYLNANGFSP